MRVALPMLALAGCGPVVLGDVPQQHAPAQDAGSQLPAKATEVEVMITVANVGCEGCFELEAAGKGGKAPYRFEWDDGSSAAKRRVCPGDAGTDTVSVTATDASHEHSRTGVTRLTFPDASCPPPPPLLCIENPSFEGKPAVNDGNAANFDAAPWSACPNPLVNTPDVANDTIKQPVAMLPTPTAGNTFLGIQEGEQVSQKLCEAVPAGTELFLKLDARRLYIGAGVTPDTELPWVEIWAGLSADCSQAQLLWASEPLPDTWTTFCAPLRFPQYADQITLRAVTDKSLPSLAYLLVDNLAPVESCP